MSRKGETTMTQEKKALLAAALGGFRLPRYEEIPTVGLYLEHSL